MPLGTLAKVPLGTDALGRDVFAGVIYGARVSLLVGLVSTLVALIVGVPVGALAGYFGGRIDDLLMRFTELFQTVPSFALAIVLVAILQPSITSIVASTTGRRCAPRWQRSTPAVLCWHGRCTSREAAWSSITGLA